MRHFLNIAMGLTVIAGALASCSWNGNGTGPEIDDPRTFFGCYGFANNSINLARETAEIRPSAETTNIKGYFSLKGDVVVNTANSLRLDSSGRSLRLGSGTTGFFYKFDSQSNPTALFVVDDDSNVRALPKIPC